VIIAVAPDKIDIVLVRATAARSALGADQAQSRNAAAFLIDGDDRLDLAQIAQVVDQLSQLRRTFDVAPEQNEPARLDAPKHFRTGGVELFAGNTAQDELA